MAKKIDPAAKAKRQKVIAGVLGAVLLAVLAFQGPRTLKMLHQSSASASPAATTTATATGTTGAAGALAASVSASGGDGLNDPGVLPAPQSGQLLGFSRFRSKDPFAQQINTACTNGNCGSGSSGSAAQAPSSSAGTKATKPAGAPKTIAPIASAAKASSAEISVNGASQKVAVGAKFPTSNPTFVLVSLAKSSAKIGIAGGSLQGGKQTVTLKKGVPLTLMNTADGTRYVLRLVSVG